MADTHNGWRNYETWVTSLYLDGNYDGEQTYRDVLDLARQVEETEPDERTKYALAQVLRDLVTDRVMPDGGLAGDLVGAALSEVDWDTLASHKLEEINKAA